VSAFVTHQWMTNECVRDLEDQGLLAQVCAQLMEHALEYQEGIRCTVPPGELVIRMHPPLDGTPEAEAHPDSQAVRVRWPNCPEAVEIVQCPACGGTGALFLGLPERCWWCGGARTVTPGERDAYFSWKDWP